MTTFYLVRHAETATIGRVLAGRAPGLDLNERGRESAVRLAHRLREVPLAAVHSSPMERTMQTATSIAGPHGLDVQTSDAWHELDVGDWTGRGIGALDSTQDPEERALWTSYNVLRSLSAPPSGELALQVQLRAVTELGRLHERHPDGHVAIVSHAEPLRLLLGYLLGAPVDLWSRLEVLPGAVSVVRWGQHGPTLIRLNDGGGPLA